MYVLLIDMYCRHVVLTMHMGYRLLAKKVLPYHISLDTHHHRYTLNCLNDMVPRVRIVVVRHMEEWGNKWKKTEREYIRSRKKKLLKKKFDLEPAFPIYDRFFEFRTPEEVGELVERFMVMLELALDGYTGFVELVHKFIVAFFPSGKFRESWYDYYEGYVPDEVFKLLTNFSFDLRITDMYLLVLVNHIVSVAFYTKLCELPGVKDKPRTREWYWALLSTMVWEKCLERQKEPQCLSTTGTIRGFDSAFYHGMTCKDIIGVFTKRAMLMVIYDPDAEEDVKVSDIYSSYYGKKSMDAYFTLFYDFKPLVRVRCALDYSKIQFKYKKGELIDLTSL